MARSLVQSLMACTGPISSHPVAGVRAGVSPSGHAWALSTAVTLPSCSSAMAVHAPGIPTPSSLSVSTPGEGIRPPRPPKSPRPGSPNGGSQSSESGGPHHPGDAEDSPGPAAFTESRREDPGEAVSRWVTWSFPSDFPTAPRQRGSPVDKDAEGRGPDGLSHAVGPLLSSGAVGSCCFELSSLVRKVAVFAMGPDKVQLFQLTECSLVFYLVVKSLCRG